MYVWRSDTAGALRNKVQTYNWTKEKQIGDHISRWNSTIQLPINGWWCAISSLHSRPQHALLCFAIHICAASFKNIMKHHEWQIKSLQLLTTLFSAASWTGTTSTQSVSIRALGHSKCYLIHQQMLTHWQQSLSSCPLLSTS